MNMKKIGLLIMAFGLMATSVQAQKFGYVDTKYILQNIPDYDQAQEQLNQLSAQWQKEIEEKYAEIDRLYEAYKMEKILLTDQMKKAREQEILRKEKEAKELQQKRFGPQGDLFNKRLELVKPIQDQIYNAIQALAERGNYAVIFDRSSELRMIYADPKYDLSDRILDDLGYGY
ncbi:MAG: OmpH family outer membrane protein [Flavobacteriales bacterium]|nr:OmpH family outer membrane protein [Flavobacteriales bacterium]